MSLIPSNTSNTSTPFTPFPQHFWDQFFSHDLPLQPFQNPPFPFQSSFPFPPFRGRTVPYSELSIETSGDVKARLECKEIPEAHIIAAELPGVEKDEVEVTAEDGGFVRISGGGGRFLWRLRLPEDAKVEILSESMENGVLTIVVPKMNPELGWEWEWEWDRGNEEQRRNVREIEITGSD